MAKVKTWVVLSDVQIPFQDKKVLALVVAFVKKLKPYGVILNGDIVDCYPLSSYDKNPTRHQIEREFIELGALMDDMKESGAKELHYLAGNHEDRLRRYIWRHAPELNLPSTDFPVLFNLDVKGFKWKPYGGKVMLGKLIVTHGDIVRKYSSFSAKANFEKYGNSILCGHTHRMGAFYKTNFRDTHVAYENGCLCRLDAEYCTDPDWQHGFSVVHVDDSGFFSVQQIPIIKRRVLFFGAERFEG